MCIPETTCNLEIFIVLPVHKKITHSFLHEMLSCNGQIWAIATTPSGSVGSTPIIHEDFVESSESGILFGIDIYYLLFPMWSMRLWPQTKQKHQIHWFVNNYSPNKPGWFDLTWANLPSHRNVKSSPDSWMTFFFGNSHKTTPSSSCFLFPQLRSCISCWFFQTFQERYTLFDLI